MFSAVLLAAALQTDPYAIFARAREVWMEQRYPAVVGYTVDVAATAANGETAHRHYHEYWRAADGSVFVKPPESDEQLAHPYKPAPGVNFMNIVNVGGPRNGVGDRDFIGVPQLAPNYAFGVAPYVPPGARTPAELVKEIRDAFHDPAPDKVRALEAKTGLKTIATVSSNAHAYTIVLAGVDVEAGATAYHLRLEPLQDPLKYRLRDLWIDTRSFVLERARIGGNFLDAATEAVGWSVAFHQYAGATYISHEDAEAPIVGYHGLMYRAYRVSFDELRATVLPQYAAATTVTEPLTEP